MSLLVKLDDKILFEYLDWVKKHRAPKTFAHARTAMNILKKFAIKMDRPLFELTSHEIEDYLLIDYPNAFSFNAYRSDLKNFYRYCVDKELIAHNLIVFPRAKEPKTLPKPLTPNQQQKLLEVTKYNVKWHFAIELMLGTGIRREELVKLNISDIDEVEGVLRVRATSQGGGGKGDKERIIPIGSSLISSFHHYMKEYRVNKPHNEWLFPGYKKGEHVTPESFRRYLGRRKKKLNFKVSPHMLRHSFASNHINRETDIRVLQVLLGHEKITTTEKYTKVNLVAMRRAQEKGTIFGEKDQLIQELTEKDRKIQTIEKMLKEAGELFRNMKFTIDEIKEQD